MSDFKKILAFRDIVPYLNKMEQVELANTLGMNLDDIDKRLIGKNKEDEFVLILLLMEVCKSITGFDEGVSKLLKTATSDLLIELKDGKKFLLEIKHTGKDELSISGGNLQRKIDYSRTLGLDLFFAVSIKGLWTLFNAEYIKLKRGKVDISSLEMSELDDILGCASFIFPKGVRIKSVYSTDPLIKAGGAYSLPYGNLVSYELHYNNKKIFMAKGKNSPYWVYVLLLQALQDQLSMDAREVKPSGEFTIINEYFTENFNPIPEYRFLLSTIEHTVKTGDTSYTAHTYVEKMKESDTVKMHFNRNHIWRLMQELSNRGIDIKYKKDGCINKLKPNA